RPTERATERPIERPAAAPPERAAAAAAQPSRVERSSHVEVGRRSPTAETPLAAHGDRPRSRVIVAGPQVVSRVGDPTPPQTARAQERASTPPPSRRLPPRVVPPRGPQIEHKRAEPTVDARTQFERDLERARARTAEREPARAVGTAGVGGVAE